MILNEIALHNFMSYADARLDLTSVAVACLAGSNGAGKSALLDAVTWAVWDEARSSSEELIRLGQSEMWVEVSFSLEGNLYRIKRSRQKASVRPGGKGSSKGSLELQVAGSDGWRSLTAPSVRDTQRQISNLLRMDYGTFINSVYLRQGRADEFTTRLPSERKQILGEILGLSLFDQLQELSREKARDLKSRIAVLESDVDELPDLHVRIADLERELSDAESRAAVADEKAASCESENLRLTARLREAHIVAERLASAVNRESELEADIAQLATRELELAARHSLLSELIGRSAEIQVAAGQFNECKRQVEELEISGSKLQELTDRRMTFQSGLAGIRSRLEVQLDHLRTLCADLERRREQLSKEFSEQEKIEAAYRRFKEMVAQESELSVRQEVFVKLSARADELYSLVTEARIRLEAEMQQKTAACDELEQLLASSTLLDEEKQSIERQAAELDRLEADFELVEQNGLKAKSDLESIETQVSNLRLRQQEIAAKIRELEEHSDSSICPLCSAPIVDRLAVINRYRGEMDGIDREVFALADRREALEAERTGLRKRYTELRAKLATRKSLDKQIGQFNEKIAATARAQASAGEIKGEILRLVARLEKQDYAQIERESLINVKAQIYKLDFDPVIYANLQGQIRMQRNAESRFYQMQRDLSEQKKVEQQLAELTQQASEISGQLASDDYGNELRAGLAVVTDEIKQLGYDRDKHQELRQRLGQLIGAAEGMRDLERARAERPEVDAALDACQAVLKSKKDQLAQLIHDIELWQKQQSETPQLESELSELEPLLAQWRSSRERLGTELAVIRSRVSEMRQLRDSIIEQKKELDAARSDLDDLVFLSEAFGKKGIQAVIIENAIPEIESEANHILSRLSDNQMHVALASQHKTKSGSVVETLDLLIADALGTRSYELYSGGEAFKVDFAVRVALSKLLARRAGAKLETLIIDEGFGSQDEQSRDRLVRVIGSIQNDFARILIITHISAVKEMFPTHILVTKEKGVSEIQIA